MVRYLDCLLVVFHDFRCYFGYILETGAFLEIFSGYVFQFWFCGACSVIWGDCRMFVWIKLLVIVVCWERVLDVGEVLMVLDDFGLSLGH